MSEYWSFVDDNKMIRITHVSHRFTKEIQLSSIILWHLEAGFV